MIAEIALGVSNLLLVVILYKQNEDWRAERRELLNRILAKNVPELAVLQNVTAPKPESPVARVNIDDPEARAKAPSLPLGL